MIFWTIQQIILSITIIACIHYIYVYFKKFIRPEKKFKNLKHLKVQIKLDIKQAKK